LLAVFVTRTCALIEQPEFSQTRRRDELCYPDSDLHLVEGLFARVFKLIGVELPIPFRD